MRARQFATSIGDTARLYFCFSTIFAIPGAMIGTVAGVAFFGPKGLLQSAGVLKANEGHDTVAEIAKDSAKSIAKCTLFGAAAYPLSIPYVGYKAAETVCNTVKKHM